MLINKVLVISLFFPLYLYSLPIEAKKLRLEYNNQKVKITKRIFENQTQAYEMGIVSFSELVSWNEKLYKLKYDILLSKFSMDDLHFDPQINSKYLKEKLIIHLEELEFFKMKIPHFVWLKKEDLLILHDLEIFQLKTIDAYASFKITAMLYEMASSTSGTTYVDLPKEVKKLF